MDNLNLQKPKLILRDQVFEVKPGIALYHALEKIGINREGVLPVRDGELITDDEILHSGDVVRLIAVISGG